MVQSETDDVQKMTRAALIDNDGTTRIDACIYTNNSECSDSFIEESDDDMFSFVEVLHSHTNEVGKEKETESVHTTGSNVNFEGSIVVVPHGGASTEEDNISILAQDSIVPSKSLLIHHDDYREEGYGIGGSVSHLYVVPLDNDANIGATWSDWEFVPKIGKTKNATDDVLVRKTYLDAFLENENVSPAFETKNGNEFLKSMLLTPTKSSESSIDDENVPWDYDDDLFDLYFVMDGVKSMRGGKTNLKFKGNPKLKSSAEMIKSRHVDHQNRIRRRNIRGTTHKEPRFDYTRRIIKQPRANKEVKRSN